MWGEYLGILSPVEPALHLDDLDGLGLKNAGSFLTKTVWCVKTSPAGLHFCKTIAFAARVTGANSLRSDATSGGDGSGSGGGHFNCQLSTALSTVLLKYAISLKIGPVF